MSQSVGVEGSYYLDGLTALIHQLIGWAGGAKRPSERNDRALVGSVMCSWSSCLVCEATSVNSGVPQG